MIIPQVHENAWKPMLEALPPWQPPVIHTLVISPHPDDETLGAGGLIARLRLQGVEVTVVAVTDGENAYENTPGQGVIRELEQHAALVSLGVDAQHILRLRLPDSGLHACEEQFFQHLLALPAEDVHIVAPWHGDFHPDHEVCGRVAKRLAEAKNLPLTYYFFWTWHRGTTETLQGLPLVALPLTQTDVAAKHQALACHRSQLEHPSGQPILPEYLLEPVGRPYEVYLPA